jgi:hypothetical protein
MAHFAELDSNNIVMRVLVIHDNDCLDENGIESEEVGSAYCNNLLGGRWVQTSYNNRIRRKYAGIGDKFVESLDVFIAPQLYLSWHLDDEYNWQPPTPYPTDNKNYFWDEGSRQWVRVS